MTSTDRRRTGNQVLSDSVPPSPYYVVATDSRVSFTNAADGRRAIMVFLAKDAAQARIVEMNVSARDDLRDVSVVRSFKADPTLLVSLQTEAQNPYWYESGTFRLVQDETYKGFSNWATAETYEIAKRNEDTLKLIAKLLVHDTSGRTVRAAIERLMKKVPEQKKMLLDSQTNTSERIDWTEVVDRFRKIFDMERRNTVPERRKPAQVSERRTTTRPPSTRRAVQRRTPRKG